MKTSNVSSLMIAAFCAAVVGCGGNGSPPAAATRTATRSSADKAASDQPVFPSPTAKQRAQLADDGLVRSAPPQLRKACERTAKDTDWTVLCPTRVPGGRLAVIRFGVAGTSKDFSKGYEFSVNSGALHEDGAPDPGHWTFAAGTPEAMHDQLTAYGHGEPLSERQLRVAGIRVTRYEEPSYGKFPGVYGGHIVYQWTQGRAVLQVSVHNGAHERVLRGLVRLLGHEPDPSPPGPAP